MWSQGFESRRVIADSAGELKVVWDEIPKVKVRREGTKHVASLSGLRPGIAYAVRVVPLGSAGEHGKRLFTQFFVTPAAADWWPKFTLLRVLFVAFALCVGFILRQRWLARRRA